MRHDTCSPTHNKVSKNTVPKGILYKSWQISNYPLVETCRLCNLPTLVFQCRNHLPKDGHNSTETRRKFRLNKHSRVSNFTSAAKGSCVQYCSKNWHHLTSQRKVAEPSWSNLTGVVYKNLQRTNPPLINRLIWALRAVKLDCADTNHASCRRGPLIQLAPLYAKQFSRQNIPSM